jgi:hypothetical protein
MMRTSLLGLVAAIAVVAGGIWAWHTWWPGDGPAIRRQLDALASTVNEEVTEGLGTVARAAEIGSYFSQDVMIDLGQGAPPIQGRETLIGLAARLQTPTAAHTLAFEDVTVDVRPGADAADVTCAATLTRRNPSTGERAVDARELQLGMTKSDGVWRIARVTAVDTLRRQ